MSAFELLCLLPFSLLTLSFSFYLSSPQVEEGGFISPPNYDESAKRCALHLFFRNNCLTQPTSCTFSWQSRGRRERQLLCSQACSCTGLVVTEFTVSTGCQANWDFTMDKALGLPFSGIFCRRSLFLFLYSTWQVTFTHFKITSAPKCMDFNLSSIWILQTMRSVTTTDRHLHGLVFCKDFLYVSMLLVIMVQK